MRKLLTIGAAVVAIAAGALVFVVLPSDDDGSTGTKGLNAVTATRTYSSTSTYLEVGGYLIGKVTVVAPGGPYAEVVSNDLGPEGQIKKHVANVRLADIVVDVPLGEASRLQSWLSAAWTNVPSPTNGSVTTFDSMAGTGTTTSFTGALLTSTVVPTADVTQQTSAALRLTITPEAMVTTTSRQASPTTTPGKAALSANFRFELPDLPSARISKVDSFEVKTTINQDEVGIFREPTKYPAKLTVPNLRVTVAAADAEPWKAWAEDFLVKGNNGDEREKAGALTFLAPDLKASILRIDLGHCGVIRAVTPPVSGDQVGPLVVDLYCESMAPTFTPVP